MLKTGAFKGVIYNKADVYQALIDLYAYYQAAPENNNTRAAKQALKEILNQNTLEALNHEK